MARDISWVAWPALWPSSYSMGRKSWLYVAKISTSLGNSSERNVRIRLFLRRRKHHYILVDYTFGFMSLASRSILTEAICPVKYLAYLRKMTRYNPTRGGKKAYFGEAFALGKMEANLSTFRPVPFSCSFTHLLQDRPRHDTTQDSPRRCGHGTPKGLRRCSSTL